LIVGQHNLVKSAFAARSKFHCFNFTLILLKCLFELFVKMEPPEDRPSTIHTDEAMSPKGPWSFFAGAIRGGFSFWGIQLILGWAAFQALTTLSWAAHLKAKLGNSSLADNWGELLTARDVWEIMENANLKDSILGFWTVGIGAVAMLWILWSGWKLQVKPVGLKAGFLPWLTAIPTALLVGYLPLWMLHAFLWNIFAYLASLGIQFLGWINLFAGPLLRMAFASALMLQWWLCRIDLAHNMPSRASEWLIHMKDSFFRLWTHPVQWGNIVLFGVAIRAGLAFCILLLAWKWGGQSLLRIRTIFLLQIAVSAINAWIIGWLLRLTARYWKHDMEVRSEVRALESSVRRKSARL
jgi:hypothetical protein